MQKTLALTALILTGIVLGNIGTKSAQAEPNTNYTVAKRAVCHYFTGSLCREGMAVVDCETGGTYSPWAKNGQYLGIFQMGSGERNRFGHGNNVWAQAKAARKYFNYEVSIGNWGWHPWSCKTAI